MTVEEKRARLRSRSFSIFVPKSAKCRFVYNYHREKQTATEYLKSKGFDPTTNLAELIRNQIAKDESDIENGILPLAGGTVRIRRESSSAQVTEEAPL